MSTEQDRRLAQKFLNIANRSGPKITRQGDRLVIEENGQTIAVELNSNVQQSSSTPRFR